MDINYIKLHLVIDRYVQGTLGEDELAEFEERLVWDAELREEVVLADTLRSWLRRSVTENQFAVADNRTGDSWVDKLRVVPGYAVAASFVLGILVTYSLSSNIDPDFQYALDPSSPTVVMPLIATRSADDDLQTVPAATGAMTLLLVDVPYPELTYRVAVRREGTGELVWNQSGLVPSYLETVAVGIPGAALSPATYTLAIESADGAQFRQEISFKTDTSE